MAAERHSDQLRLGALLPEVLKRVEHQHAVLALIRRHWPRLVGRELAKHAQPGSVRRGQLVIVTHQPGDSFALSFQRERLAQRLQALTEGTVHGIIIRPGAGPTHGLSH